jgi:ribosomal protein L30/L7E
MMSNMGPEESAMRTIVVLMRSPINADPKVRETLRRLNLNRKFTARIVEIDDVYRGMLHRIKDWATWGEISMDDLLEHVPESCFEKLRVSETGELISMTVRLHPPRGGARGINQRYCSKTQKGSLGPRDSEIVDLIKRMSPGPVLRRQSVSIIQESPDVIPEIQQGEPDHPTIVQKEDRDA